MSLVFSPTFVCFSALQVLGGDKEAVYIGVGAGAMAEAAADSDEVVRGVHAIQSAIMKHVLLLESLTSTPARSDNSC